MSSNEPLITTRMSERRTEYIEPDQKKIQASKKVSQKMATLANEIAAARSQIQSVHSMMDRVTSGSVLDIHSTGNSTYNRTKSDVEHASTHAKQASSAAKHARTTRRMLKIERIRSTYEDGRLIREEVVSVDRKQLD